MIIVSLFIVSMLTLLVRHLIRHRSFDGGALLLTIWSTSSLFSLYYFLANQSNYHSLSFLPFIYLLVILLISFHPILSYRSDNIKSVIGPTQFIYYLSLFSICTSIIPIVENLIQLLSVGINKQSIVDVYNLKREEDVVDWFSWIGRKTNALNNLFSYIHPILFFYWLSKNKATKKLSLYLLIPITNGLIYAILISARVTLVTMAIYYFFLYILFKNSIVEELKKRIKLYGLVGGGVLLSLILVISIVRFKSMDASDMKILDWISLYGGEGTLNFNQDMWTTKAFMNGDNNFSLFKSLLGIDTFTDILDRRAYWEPRTGIRGHVFYTFIGDIYGDLGPMLCLLLFLVISWIIRKELIKGNKVPFHSIILLSTWYSICATGFTFYAFKTTWGSLILILHIVLYTIMKYLTMKSVKRRSNG